MKTKILTTILVILLSLNFIVAEHALPSDFSNDTTSMMQGIGDWAYNVTEGFFWWGLLAGFCVVLWISAIQHDIGRAFGYAGITGIFGSIFLIMMGWISWAVASIFIIAGSIAIGFMVKNK